MIKSLSKRIRNATIAASTALVLGAGSAYACDTDILVLPGTCGKKEAPVVSKEVASTVSTNTKPKNSSYRIDTGLEYGGNRSGIRLGVDWGSSLRFGPYLRYMTQAEKEKSSETENDMSSRTLVGTDLYRELEKKTVTDTETQLGNYEGGLQMIWGYPKFGIVARIGGIEEKVKKQDTITGKVTFTDGSGNVIATETVNDVKLKADEKTNIVPTGELGARYEFLNGFNLEGSIYTILGKKQQTNVRASLGWGF